MLVPLRDHRYDLDALLAAVTPRTKIVYVCHPNNPTGTMNTRDELDAFFERVPRDVLVVVDQAYFEYIDRPDYPDAVDEYFKRGRDVARPAHVLEDLRPRRAAGRLRGRAGEVLAAMAKVRRPFDVRTTAQVAALASIADTAEIARRSALTPRAARASAHGRGHGLSRFTAP